MPLISADALYTPEGWVRDQALNLDPSGCIRGWQPLAPQDQAQRHAGLLVPGWVNAHCHLELSALKGQIPEGTGMTGFIGRIFQARAARSEAELSEGVAQALAFLARSGTAAVGDISNLPLSAAPKRAQSEVYVHTFVEVLGLNPAEAEQRMAQGRVVAAAFAGLPHSLTPHAPYSTTRELFAQLYQTRADRFSLHLMESGEEVELFATGGGAFERFYRDLGLPYQPFAAQDPVDHALAALPSEQPILLVHNTELSPQRLGQLAQRFPKAYFCLCPRANQYIHGKLPPAAAFAQQTDRICLGTDSLASNYDLDLWGELRALHAAFPGLGLHRLLRWATTGGAQALGIDKNFGTFVPDSRPGILLVEGVEPQGTDFRLTERSRVRVLFDAGRNPHSPG